MEELDVFGITAIKQEAEETSSNDNKDICGSSLSVIFMEHKADSFGGTSDCQHNTGNLKLESKIDEDKVLPVATLYDNDSRKQGYGLPSIPGLTRICLKKETDLNCLNNMPSHIYPFAENDVAKQEVSYAGKKTFRV
ncbi:uncharacterized protein LOC136034038 [Artemia franciscana]|uniref:uncharacterized protein LOC136034038 n=1 Tax=Artemia franciscana TaxID=6661 RepID=UPI0032DA9C11